MFISMSLAYWISALLCFIMIIIVGIVVGNIIAFGGIPHDLPSAIDSDKILDEEDKAKDE